MFGKYCVVFFPIFVLGDAYLLADMYDWNAFKEKHSKHYDTWTDEIHHFRIFVDHKHKIAAHNLNHENGIVSFEMGLNKYSDLSFEEFNDKLNGYKPHSGVVEHDDESFYFSAPTDIILPKYVDYRHEGAVTPVKDQETCGSCYSFAATGAVESHYFLKTGHLLSLSEQNLVDCSKSYGNHGCGGGWPKKSMKYMQDHGVYAEDVYPYHGRENSFCESYAKKSNVTVKGFTSIPSGDEEKLQMALAIHGPVSVLIDADHFSFHYYKKGVWYEPDCRTGDHDLDHAVLLVGYGTDEYNVDYYILKNSWGSSWGEAGYFRMSRNHMNHCGIATNAVFPII